MIRQTASGVTISIVVQPKSTRDGPTGIAGNEKAELRWAVHAPAADGKANKALIASVASFFDVRKSEVRIVKGEVSRHKQVEILGLSAEAVGKMLVRLFPELCSDLC